MGVKFNPCHFDTVEDRRAAFSGMFEQDLVCLGANDIPRVGAGSTGRNEISI